MILSPVFRRFFVLIISLVIFSLRGYGQVLAGQDIFIPDQSVELLAQQFDGKYFPVFLRSLDEISTHKDGLIKKYFLPLPAPTVRTRKINIRDTSLGIIPVYRDNSGKFKDYTLSFPADWSDTIHRDPTWLLWYNSLNWTEDYLESANPDSVLTAFKIIGDWIAAHTLYPMPQMQYAFDDHGVAERLVILQKAYRRYNQLGYSDPRFRSELLLSILSHVFFIGSLETYKCWHNHAIIFDEKLIGALKDLPEFRPRNEFLKLAFSRELEQYRYAMTSEGVHKEHSPCYHKLFTSELKSVIASAHDLKVPVSPSLEEILKKAEIFSRYADLNGQNFAIGDCAGFPAPKPIRPVPGKTPGVKETTPTECGFRGKLFPRSGWLFVYDSTNLMSIVAQSDFYGWSHYQQDETSFVIKSGNRDLITDPGLYSYQPSPVYDYYRSMYAHNMLVVNGLKNWVDTSYTGMAGITRYYQEFSPKGIFSGAVEMTHANYKKDGIDIYRQFIFTGDYKMFVRDIVTSPEPHTYSQLFHLAKGAKISKSSGRIMIKWDDGQEYLLMLSTCDSARIVTGRKEPMQGWVFPAFNKMEEAPVLELDKTGTNIEILTTIFIGIPGCDKSNRSFSEKKYKELVAKLESIKRLKLTHHPFPERWKSARKQ